MASRSSRQDRTQVHEDQIIEKGEDEVDDVEEEQETPSADNVFSLWKTRQPQETMVELSEQPSVDARPDRA